MSSIGKLPYLEACVLEALRLYPPAFMVGRCAAEDVQLGKWTVKKGNTLAAC